ncbi:phage major capsid protein [Oceanobacillus kimchii]|uniref:phage major capsid protein n=1 Tax=Oceanobacillus kimchii TaxID=746691 RepID=UPI0021A62AB3|nr:phage major capsid protein [Oceanobacillus kimchii]MCT1577540.1 phage major capsid protein [Oceanobacillus kimchii]MCT2136528.1 phage major capsid protein [Oceanobacillus kimchii]
MTIKFNNFEEKKQAFANATKNGTEEEQTAALNNMLESLATDVQGHIFDQVNTQMADNVALQSRGQNTLTSEETKFFNAVIEDGGFKEKETLPETTQERIFDEIVQDHPFLNAIGIRNLGAVTEFIYSNDPTGQAVWGDLFDGIKGQLNATFRKEKISQLKLTAFVPIAKDMLKLGPAWVERYVRTIIVEALRVGLERGFITGRGSSQNEPVGLLKNVNLENGAVTDKTPLDTLTFKPGRTTINELKKVVKKLAEKLNKDGEKADRPRKVAGKIVMVTNPFDTFDIQANATTQNTNGVYVTNLPFNPITTESVFIPEGKVLFFVKDEYIAAVGGGVEMSRYKETLAMEDADLFIGKQFATGKPKDNNAAQLYNLDLDLEIEEPAPQEPEGA